MTYRDGKSRGFSFIKFYSLDSAKTVLKQEILKMRGKVIECKLAMSKEMAKVNGEVEIQKKVFVSNLSLDAQETDLMKYFSKFGEITDVQVVRGINNLKSRGIGFVKFREANKAHMLL